MSNKIKEVVFMPSFAWDTLILWVAVLTSYSAYAQKNETEIDKCLQLEILQADNSVTVDAIREKCNTKPNIDEKKNSKSLIDLTRERVLGSDTDEKFTLYKLNYALLNGNDSKMLFSFKYKLYQDWDVYFAYSSLVVWDLFSDSIPYRDINFMPDFFYRFETDTPWLASLDAGYTHNSNGRDGAESRALDRLFVRFNKYFNVDNISIFWTTNLFYTVSESKNNPDISDYWGFWETRMIAMNMFDNKNIGLGFSIVSGDNGNPFENGNYTIDFLYRMKNQEFNPYWYLQYFNGYGEYILDYNKKVEELRVGVAFYY